MTNAKSRSFVAMLLRMTCAKRRTRCRAVDVLLWVVVVLLVGGATARAQSDQTQLVDRKFEVGAQFAFFRESELPLGTSLPPFPAATYLALYNSETTSPNSPGFGGRVGYNISTHIAVEGEFNFFPRETGRNDYLVVGLLSGEPSGEPTYSETSIRNGWKTEAVFGVKAGGRIEKIGLFGKARPGLMYFSEVRSGGSDTNFAMDLGGVIEYYPSRRTLIRVDLSDLIVRFDERSTGAGTYSFTDLTNVLLGGVTFILPSRVLRPAQTTHNFRLGLGFGFRF